MDVKYVLQIAADANVPVKSVTNIFQMHEEGATIPFISRYRKEATGNLDEVQIATVIDKIKYFQELEKRKETVLKTIEAAGKLTEELKKRIEESVNATEIEDIYLPFKPKRKTKATVAIEKGLQPLAEKLFALEDMDIASIAKEFINEQVTTQEEALQGARDIMAEWVAEHEDARNVVRKQFAETATVSAKVLSSKKEEEEAQKYRDYFDYKEPLSKAPSHRILAIRRGEKEGFLIMDIAIEKEVAIAHLKDIFITTQNPSAEQLGMAIEDAFSRLLKSSIETEFRLNSKTLADEEAIRVFAENLRQLLLASPLGAKRVLALDPGFRTGCKVVCLDEQGGFLKYDNIFPHAPQNEWEQSKYKLKSLVKEFNIDAIGYGNGTASKETEALVRAIDFEKPVAVFMVNESGASIYSASDVAREEFPDKDVTVRGAISIGRRLLDPLSELVKIDAKSIGVGQYQHDVNQNRLKDSLDQVVESCVNYVGVNLNTASKHLLMYVSGLTATTAKNIVEYREKNGAFTSRKQLLDVSKLGPKAYEQSAGFLRIPEAKNPLDNSSVHPETYHVVEKMAQSLSCNIDDLIQQKELRKSLKVHSFVSEEIGIYTIEDILKELDKPGRDPRSTIEEFRFSDDVKTMEDVKVGMKLPGIITNITNFGAFVDIGVKQDGLVHVSHLADKFVSDPNEVVKLNQKVMVTVLEADVARKRISLSMKGEGVKPAAQKPKESNKPKASVPKNSFQNSLDVLRKKFAD